MKVMLDKDWAAAVSLYSGRVKNHTRPPILSIERELEERQLYNNFLYIAGGGGEKKKLSLSILKQQFVTV